MSAAVMLYMIGLGLCDERDITVRGLDAVRSCASVYLEAYTSILLVGKEKLEALYGKEVQLLDREKCESDSAVDAMLEEARTADVAFLVVGDVFGATTHSDMQLRAAKAGIDVRVIHNSTVMTAVGACGLQLYRFGECISIVFFTESWRPDSFYDKIKANMKNGLHTLCLLDIRVKVRAASHRSRASALDRSLLPPRPTVLCSTRACVARASLAVAASGQALTRVHALGHHSQEPDMEALCMGKKRYEPPRYMSVNTAIEELLEIEEKRGEGVYSRESMAVGLARVGSGERQQIVAGTMGELLEGARARTAHAGPVRGITR